MLNYSSNLRICILYGGFSSERDISIISGQAVESSLRDLGHTEITKIDVTRDIHQLSNLITNSHADIVFNTLHGRFGEDGSIQGILDIIGIPYTNSGRIASTLAMEKVIAKKLFASSGLPVAKDCILSISDLKKTDPLPRPYVIKPLNEGSSLGVSIINDDDDILVTCSLFSSQNTIVMAEEFIPGKELTVAILGNRSLAVTEIKTFDTFYNYKAKYDSGASSHIIPANIDKIIYEEILDISLEAHKTLGCRGVTRVDLRLNNHDPYILEINTQPGLTPTSLVPEQASFIGMEFNDLVLWMLENAQCD